MERVRAYRAAAYLRKIVYTLQIGTYHAVGIRDNSNLNISVFTIYNFVIAQPGYMNNRIVRWSHFERRTINY